VFIAQVLVGPSKQLKLIFQIEHNIVKNPNWPEANQLAIYKRGRGFEHGATEKQTQVVVRAGLEPGTAGLRVRHADHSATLPPLLEYMEGEFSQRARLRSTETNNLCCEVFSHSFVPFQETIFSGPR